MEELYKEIEKRILAAGYSEKVDGFQIYEQISDQIEGKENGSYIFLSKRSEDVYFEYKVDVMEKEFNLSYIDIYEGEHCYHVNFDD